MLVLAVQRFEKRRLSHLFVAVKMSETKTEPVQETKTPFNWRPMFAGIFWPAAAGNVFWSFCTLLIETVPAYCDWNLVTRLTSLDFDGDAVARLFVLFVLAIYLSFNWMRVRVVPRDIPFRFWLFDFIHLWLIIFAALSAYAGNAALEWLLAALFLSSMIGHVTGIFGLAAESEEEKRKEKADRRSLIVANGVGIVVMLVHFLGGENSWSAPLSVLLVLILWLRAGRGKNLIQKFRAVESS